MTTVFFKFTAAILMVCFLDTSITHALENTVKLDLSYITFAEKNNSGSQNHFDFNLNYKAKAKMSKDFSFNLEAQAYVATFPDEIFTVPQVELVYKLEDSSFHLGRTRVKYGTYLDTDWIMGVQSSFSRNTPLNPEIQGVTGLSYIFESDQVYLHLYSSPVSIPDQGPSLDVDQNGFVSSDNPWAIVAPSQAELSTGAELNLRYELLDDSLPELLRAYQFGGTLGVKTDKLDIFGMYANRPSKQLDFELDAKLQTVAPGLVKVKAKPVFRREHFFGVQSELRWSSEFSLNNGFYALVLIDDDSPSAYQTSHPDYFFITTALNFKINSKTISLKHLFTKPSENNNATGVLYIESSRFLYEDSLMLSLNDVKFNELQFNTEIVYSYKSKAARFRLYGEYAVNKKFKVHSELNLIHDFDKESETVEDLSISSGLAGYASLDNFNLGVAYVF